MTAGEQLRSARMERKLSLGDVAQQTKIQPWVLEALERDQLHQQMSPIYARGFLSSYAKYLRLQPELLVAQLWPKVESQPPPASVQPAIPVVIEFPWPLIRRIGMVGMACAAIAGLVALKPLQHLPHLTLPRAPMASAPKASKAKLASLAPLPHEVSKPPALPTLTLLPTQPLELNVSAQRTTWIQVRADGKLVTQQRLPRGANEHWTAKKKLELVVSKPSEVEVILNGQSISPFAIVHEGRLMITHYGVTKLPNESN